MKKSIILVYLLICFFSFPQNIESSDIENLSLSEGTFNEQEYIKTYYFIQEKQKELDILLIQKEEALLSLINELEKQESMDIDAINSFPWQENELDNEGNPTQAAQSFRNKQIEFIREKYQQQKTEINSNGMLDDPEINILKNEIFTEMKKLECDHIRLHSSFDEVFGYDLNISPFNNELCGWNISSSFDISNVFTFENNNVLSDYFLSVNDFTLKTFSSAYIISDKNIETETPFIYSELLISTKYNEETNRIIVTPRSITYYRTEDDSIIDCIEEYTEEIYPIENETIKDFSSDSSEPSLAKVKSEVSEKTTSSNKKKKSQQTRSGIYINFGSSKNPVGNGRKIGNQLVFGEKNFFDGFYWDYFINNIDDKYINYSYINPIDKYYCFNCGFLFGFSFNIGKIRPFLSGGYGVGNIIGSEKKTWLLNLRWETGIDLKINNIFSIGVAYTFSQIYQYGATDNFCVSFGFDVFQ